jgi:hypothetical protein
MVRSQFAIKKHNMANATKINHILAKVSTRRETCADNSRPVGAIVATHVEGLLLHKGMLNALRAGPPPLVSFKSFTWSMEMR